MSIDVGEYLAGLRSANEEADKALSLIHIGEQSFYVEQDILEFPRLEHRVSMSKIGMRRKKATIDELVAMDKLVLIEGGMGAGKSKLLRQIVERLSEPEVFLACKVLPITASFVEFQDVCHGSLNTLIEKKVPKEVRDNHSDITYLALIDGIDEKNLSPEEQIQMLRNIAEEVSSNSSLRAIITSRYLRGLEETCELDDALIRYELPPLGFAKTLEFLKRICAKLNISGRLIEDLRKSPLFRELPHSPIAAILLAKLLNENPKELPSNMTELYSQYSELMLGRWDVNKGLQTLKEYQVMEHVLMQISQKLLSMGVYLMATSSDTIRAVTHLDVSKNDMEKAIKAISEALKDSAC